MVFILQVTGWERRPSRSPINGSRYNANQSNINGYRWHHGHLVYPLDNCIAYTVRLKVTATKTVPGPLLPTLAGC